MFTQLTGQPKLEIFAEGEKDFFLKVVDAQITFGTGDGGRGTVAISNQNGRESTGCAGRTIGAAGPGG
jgi:D-alanyl-D-alanine-carboxypeptidase/D-alanyl-D-alanine-endopeptidase